MRLGSKSDSAGGRFSLGVLGLLLAGLLPGCGSSELPRIPGGGEVNQEGLAVTDYTITFTPTKEVAGPSASTMVKDGKYTFNKTNGPAKPGSYKVVVQEPVVSVNRKERKEAGKTEQPKRWDFEYTVPEKGPFTKNFDLD